MFSIQGYYDGITCIPLEKSQLLPKQKVIITALDDFFEPPKVKLADFLGCIDNQDSDKMLEALKDCESLETESDGEQSLYSSENAVPTPYPYMTLPDETGIVHSKIVNKDGKECVKIYIERPVYGGFANATCWLPDYTWEDIKGFSQKDIDYFSDIIHSGAHLFFEFARNGGFPSLPDKN